MLAEDLGSLGGICFCAEAEHKVSLLFSLSEMEIMISLSINVYGVFWCMWRAYSASFRNESRLSPNFLTWWTEGTESPVLACMVWDWVTSFVNKKNCKRPTKKNAQNQFWQVLLCCSDCRSHTVSFWFRQKKNFKKPRKCLKSLTLIYKKSCHLCGHGKPGQISSGRPKGGVRTGNQGTLMSC